MSASMRAGKNRCSRRCGWARSTAVLDRRPDGSPSISVASQQGLGRYHDNLSRPAGILGEDCARSRVSSRSVTRRTSGANFTYAQVLANREAHRRGAAAARPVRRERPIVVISGNSIEHALLVLGAMYVGIPYAPVSPAYSLMSSDFGKLRDDRRSARRPGWSLPPTAAVRARALCRQYRTISSWWWREPARRPARQRCSPIYRHEPRRRRCRRAPSQRRPDTSPSSCSPPVQPATPKAVINTHRMLCSNQAMRCGLRLRQGRAACAWSTGCRGAIPSAATTIST